MDDVKKNPQTEEEKNNAEIEMQLALAASMIRTDTSIPKKKLTLKELLDNISIIGALVAHFILSSELFRYIQIGLDAFYQDVFHTSNNFPFPNFVFLIFYCYTFYLIFIKPGKEKKNVFEEFMYHESTCRVVRWLLIASAIAYIVSQSIRIKNMYM